MSCRKFFAASFHCCCSVRATVQFLISQTFTARAARLHTATSSDATLRAAAAAAAPRYSLVHCCHCSGREEESACTGLGLLLLLRLHLLRSTGAVFAPLQHVGDDGCIGHAPAVRRVRQRGRRL
jgi:hypothetical protein